ncbi:MAG: M20/M25/M40 family metallo-hydrolase [Bacteroidetes bacterium]|nr:MAG: M20/M25/M40 family metallo-hydrolase [Bacteroidota bacterium]
MKRVYYFSFLVVLIVLSFLSLSAQEKYDSAAIAQIKEEGMKHSLVMEFMSYLTDVYGPRLTYSPGYKRAADWAAQKLTAMGLENSHIESWTPIGKSWVLNRYSANIMGSQNWPLISYPKAWSPGTKGNVTGELLYLDAKTDSALDTYKGKLKGKFILLNDPRDIAAHFEAEASRVEDSSLLDMANSDLPQPRSRGGRRPIDWTAEQRQRAQVEFHKMELIQKEGALGILTVARGDGGNIFVQQASVPAHPDTPYTSRVSAQDPKAPKILPQIAVGAEHYNRLVRMIQKGEKPKLELTMDVTMAKTDSGYNIIAELPGSDLKDEIVMIGAHYDSWQGGTGATDNATGSAVCMEAMRILKTLGLQPRRTIRIGLWGGEEQGLIGSREYVKAHFGERPQSSGQGGGNDEILYKPDAEKFSAYFNNDNGTGKVRGVYMQGNEATRTIFRSWLKPFADMGASTLTPRNTGGTDHQSFDGINLPGFQFIQDQIEYSTRTHHSTMDVYERAQEEDLKQAAVIMAAFAYNAAMRDEKFPRKPLPKPETPTHGSN